jgi:WD40 repeat protein
MRRLFFVGLFFLILMLSGALTAAQNAPDPINDALDALNERLGTSYTLNDIFWTWAQESYDDGSLGCPQALETFSSEPMVGYQFVFTVEDVEYDYRVSSDRSTVFLCSSGELPEEQAVATPEPVLDEDEAPYSNPLCGAPPPDITYMPTRLTSDITGYITPGLPVNLRADPNTTAPIIAEIAAESVFEVLAGPSCDDQGYLWWQVSVDGQTGWMAEGRDGNYFVEPLPGEPLGTNYPVLDVENAVSLVNVSELQGNFGDTVAFSPDDLTVVIPGGLGAEGVLLYQTNDLDAGVRSIPAGTGFTTVDFSDDSDLALLGGENGSIRLWNLDPETQVIERAVLLGHDDPVSAVAFSLIGATMASSGGLAFLREEDEFNAFAVALWDVENVRLLDGLRGHTDRVTGLAYTATGDQIISGSLDGTVRVWDVATATETLEIELDVAVNAIALSDDATTVAAALATGDIVLLDVATGEVSATLQAHTGAVNSVIFGVDDTVLVSGGDDAAVYVWSIEDETALVELTGHTDRVTDVAISANDVVIATVGADNFVRLWAVILTAG